MRLRSHDDATPDHVRESVDDGVSIAEFPTTMVAAEASHAAGLAVLMGAPNVVRGGSHSGNIAAVDLARENCLDVLSSDYVPGALMLAAFMLPELAEEVTPAGSDPHGHRRRRRRPRISMDRGEIVAGKRGRPGAGAAPRRNAGGEGRLAARPEGQLMAGTLVLVVGPSGAGKDTLIGAAKVALAGDSRFVFPRRSVTRPSIATIEDHDSVTAEQFALRKANGAYALSWDAHGLSYGLPASLADDLAAGRVVVSNGSRAMVGAAQQKFPGTVVLLVEASADVRARRLSGRGRESAAEVSERLAREVPDVPAGAVRIDNSGSLADGSARFVAALRVIAGI